MKHLSSRIAITGIVTFVTLATPAFAQESSKTDPRGYISMFGGPISAGGNASSTALFEGAVRVAPHIMVVGNVGHYTDLMADLQPSLASETSTLSDEGFAVTSGGKLPAWYESAGVRANIPVIKHALPYVQVGFGAAHLNPTAQFGFVSGTLPDGTVPDAGSDVTTMLVTYGLATPLKSSTAKLFSFGTGVQVPIASHWAADVGYRYAGIGADSTLSTGRLNTNAMTFGFGYRF